MKRNILKKFTDKTFSVIRKFRNIPSNNFSTFIVNGSILANQTQLDKLIQSFPTKKKMIANSYLYIIQFSNSVSMANITATRQNFQTLRSSPNRLYNFSKDNSKHPASNKIYVGISDSTRDRFRTHLGINNTKITWALYMKQWISLNDDITITIIPLINFSKDETQIIEDVIWDDLKPMFGKRGGK